LVKGITGSPRGHHHTGSYHMNEGYSSLLGLTLMEQLEDLNAIRPKCFCTARTPAPAGHDQFPPDMVRGVLGDGERTEALKRLGAYPSGSLNMTEVALHGGSSAEEC